MDIEVRKNGRGYCPNCGKGVDQKHILNSYMAKALLWFFDNPGMHARVMSMLPKSLLRIKNYQLLRHWGLIQRGTKQDTFGITELGMQFVRGEVDVPKFVICRQRRVYTKSEETVSFKQALGTNTSLEQIARGW